MRIAPHSPLLVVCTGPHGRFSHCPKYIRRLAQQCGFDMVVEQQGVLRYQAERAVLGHVHVLRRRGQGSAGR